MKDGAKILASILGIITPESNTIDTTELFFLANDENFDLYKESIQSDSYNIRRIYKGIFTNETAIHYIHTTLSLKIDEWLEPGSKWGKDVTTFVPKSRRKFDVVRFEMLEEGIIETFTIGKATSEEICKVLSYMKKEYQKKKEL